MQTIVLKEYSSNSKALAYCDKIMEVVSQQCPKATLAVNQVDTGCYQVELIGEFGQHVYLAPLMS